MGLHRRWLLPVVALLLAVPSPASTKACRPSSAELAYEELLEAAEDDSPAEAEAMRVGDEQEARGEFDSERTIDLLEEVAARWQLVYDCATRTYRAAEAPPVPPGEDPAGFDDEDEGAQDGGATTGGTAPGPGVPGVAPDTSPAATGEIGAPPAYRPDGAGGAGGSPGAAKVDPGDARADAAGGGDTEVSAAPGTTAAAGARPEKQRPRWPVAVAIASLLAAGFGSAVRTRRVGGGGGAGSSRHPSP